MCVPPSCTHGPASVPLYSYTEHTVWGSGLCGTGAGRWEVGGVASSRVQSGEGILPVFL